MAIVEPRTSAVEKAKRTYGEDYVRLRFPRQADAEAATCRRADLLQRIHDLAAGAEIATQHCLGTKLTSGVLSPGCAVCVDGRWSCLFINERCNTHCFYCPAPQDRVGVPMTNTLPFPRVAEYLEYLEAFGFEGASISGGEPLLDADLTIGYTRAIKRRFGSKMHVWLYTNGTLLTADLVARLSDAGLDEIRFDICATGYRLDRLRLAAGMIGHVTVEIPAVPEDREQLQGMLEEIEDAGVKSLNLHQLRLTPHNLPKLVERGYTFLHGDHVTVLESELTALAFIAHALESRVGPSINYCSSVYKSRFLRAAARRRSAGKILKDREVVTRAGFIRETKSDLQLAYHEPRILPAVTYRNPFVEVRLGRGRRIAVERSPVCPALELSVEEADRLWSVLEGLAPANGSLGEPVRRALEFELLEPGLQEYF